MKSVLTVFLDQLREPVDRRTQVILYVAIALLAFFMIDSTINSVAEELETMISEQQERIDNFDVAIVQLEVLEYTRERIHEKQTQLQALREEYAEWVERLQTCNENDIISLLEEMPVQSSTFNQLTVAQTTRIGDLDTTVYSLDLSGNYRDVIRVVDQLTRSPCGMNLIEWSLSSDPGEDPEWVEATINIRLAKQVSPADEVEP